MFSHLRYRWLLVLSMIFIVWVASFARAADGAPSPPVASLELQAEVYLRAMQMKEQMLADYRKMLDVYYELKLKSENPHVFANGAYYAGGTLPPTSERASEFASVHYDEFRSALDADPRLKGNLFVAKLNEYGTGQANDVFQRVGVYVLEPYESMDKAVYMKLYREVANPIQSVTMLEAGEIYTAASKKAGYERNGVAPKFETKKEFLEAVDAKERELSPTLIELEQKSKPKRVPKPKRPKVAGPSLAPSLGPGAATCAAGFGQL